MYRINGTEFRKKKTAVTVLPSKMKDVQGIQRGKCNSCECMEYRAPEESGRYRCDYCNHTPAEHVRIVELGACKQSDCDCDRYSSEDPNSYTECQYCGCPASQHEGAQALRKAQPRAQQPPPPSAGTVPIASVTGQMHPGAQAMGQPGAMTIQPKMSPGGVAVQTMAHGKCSFPDCPYPRRVEGGKVHDYCSRTCAQKHSQMKSSFHHQKLSSAQQAATSSPQPSFHHQQMPSAQQAAMFSAQSQPIVQQSTGQGMCTNCGVSPPNRGRSWCQSCYLKSQKP